MTAAMALVSALSTVGAAWGTVEVVRARLWEMTPLVLSGWLVAAVSAALVAAT